MKSIKQLLLMFIFVVFSVSAYAYMFVDTAQMQAHYADQISLPVVAVLFGLGLVVFGNLRRHP
ncbi:putative secreted protein with PEP-CTERM sorting signal [Alteromonadaceae bacterium 2753L.S.0a.02]|nr:putative secreted protein with PEP-CTERM sorting signal [Alteromonadaceae bacterium 2753L.S.0a.02]